MGGASAIYVSTIGDKTFAVPGSTELLRYSKFRLRERGRERERERERERKGYMEGERGGVGDYIYLY